MKAEERMRAEDPWLSKKLDELHRAFEADETFPDVIAVWEAIERVAEKNQKLSQEGCEPYPLPEWINGYLVRSADKISRLSLGIRPEDDRPLNSMNFNEVGELRSVPEGSRSRDERARHVPAALGFVRQGATAFHHHDRVTRDAAYLKIYDNPEIQDNKPLQREVRATLVRMMKKNEGGGDDAIKNRLSKARRRQRERTNEP